MQGICNILCNFTFLVDLTGDVWPGAFVSAASNMSVGLCFNIELRLVEPSDKVFIHFVYKIFP